MLFEKKNERIGIITPLNNLPINESIDRVQRQDTPLLSSLKALNLSRLLTDRSPTILSIKSSFVCCCFMKIHKLLIGPVCKLYKPLESKKPRAFSGYFLKLESVNILIA